MLLGQYLPALRYRVLRPQLEIGRKYLVGLTRYSLADSIGQKTNGGQHTYGERERRQQHDNLTRAQFAPKATHSKRDRLHAVALLSLTSRPASRLSIRPQRCASDRSWVTRTRFVAEFRLSSNMSSMM